jgi:ABC-type oligopeptide transport system substrate-binding subunit
MPRPVPVLLAASLLLALASCAPHHSHDATVARYFGDVTPPADNVLHFTLGAEPETYDPGLAVGQPDGRVCRILFEGLTREDPKTLEPLPGCADHWETSADGLVYTFHLRRGLQWSDGSRFTAEDFRWSWLRVLAPASAARYASQLYPIRNAEGFNTGAIASPESVGVAAPDESTLVVRLGHPTAYFLYLVQFYTYLPVPRKAIERWGDRWTLPQHIVGNGAFVLKSWRQNDRFVFARNRRYAGTAPARLDGLVAYTVEDLNTCTNLYKSGVFDWDPSGYIPSQFIPYMRDFADFRHASYQGTYFYSMNVTHKPLDNVWVRRALNLAVDREAIANDLLKRSREPWGNFCPGGYPGYHKPPGWGFDPVKARECLARAGYPGGRGFPKLAILFNTSEDHRRIAEALQSMWKRELGIDIELSNQEWGSFLQATVALQYDIARRSWIGDYLDPYTFLGIGISNDGNNRTGWKDARFDRLMARSSREVDPVRRLAILAEAESLLLADGPFLPVYHYSTNELVKPYVRGLYSNALDVHPLNEVWIDRNWKSSAPAVAEARR